MEQQGHSQKEEVPLGRFPVTKITPQSANKLPNQAIKAGLHFLCPRWFKHYLRLLPSKNWSQSANWLLHPPPPQDYAFTMALWNNRQKASSEFFFSQQILMFLITWHWQSPIPKVTLELMESKMMVRHLGPPPDMGPGPHGKYDWVVKVMESIPNRCQNGKGTLNCRYRPSVSLLVLLVLSLGPLLSVATPPSECLNSWGNHKQQIDYYLWPRLYEALYCDIDHATILC